MQIYHNKACCNVLIAMIPGLEPSLPLLPRGACDVEDGYVLLCAKDSTCWPMRYCERDAFAAYLRCKHHMSVAMEWSPDIIQWAQLQIPNG
jgi:hypothetical protein